ncbi:glycosyltransferase family 4 protein [Dehalococcoides mccartyi]|uniref:glycosyltransferase family 4 protein n=1 Tax=Dehalococcoides mccartyi TaxID=61435 RepID=UPI003393A3DB
MARKKLRIALISLHSCPLGQPGGRDTGGMNVYICELARTLGRLGHKVDIYTRAHDPRDDVWEFLAPNVRLIHIQAGPVEDMGKLAQYEHLESFVCGLEKFRKHEGITYDLIHSHYWLSARAGLVLSKHWNVPHLVMFHTLGKVKNRLMQAQVDPQLRLDAEQNIVQETDLIIASTQNEKEDLISLYQASADKIRVIPCGVNTNLFSLANRTESEAVLGLSQVPKALFVGRLEKLKGLDNLLRAVALIDSDMELMVVGGDEYSQGERNRLEALAGELGISDKVKFYGAVRQDMLAGYYNAARVCVVPSYYESFGMVILEAMACGTPVISGRVGVAPDIICPGVNGCLTPGNQPEQLAGCMKEWLYQKEIDRKAIREIAGKYAWQSVSAQVESVYYAILSAKTAEIV